MKNIFLLSLFLLSTFYKSQSVIIDITKSGAGQPSDYYRKDTNNLQNPFQGTYIYTNGNTSLTIVLKKMIKQLNGYHYEDLIIGEYKYVKNGIVVANTLSNLDIVYSNEFLKHGLAGSSVIPSNTFLWPCSQCNPSEKVLRALIRDKVSGRRADFFMRRTTVNGQEAMQVNITNISAWIVDSNDPSTFNEPPFALPKGEFTMIKQ